MKLADGDHFDTVIIGCGMAGLAAGIRLAHFGRDVLILERHNAAGGLNSFYSFDGRKYDVGLHAVTNFVRPGVKGTPLVKLLRQLRIARDEFALCEQVKSRVAFPGKELTFTNDWEVLEQSVADAFPDQIDAFRRFTAHALAFDETSLDGPSLSARDVMRGYITDPLLEDMLFCPLMYYGSSMEHDMDFGQFCIMFRALFREGFARPFEGVRQIIRVLLDRYRSLGGKRKMKCGVHKILVDGSHARRLILDDDTEISADHVISTAGIAETLRLCSDQPVEAAADNIGRLSFVETISILDRQPADLGWDDTIIFFNDSDRFHYERPSELVDPRSGVICFPNNYRYPEGQTLAEGVFRVTAMANYDRWTALPEDEYQAQKRAWYANLQTSALRFLPDPGVHLDDVTIVTDMFTPRTITKYTGHLQGAIYGATHKVKDGRTHLDNLYISGTDQGFLGIIGAMLSGISIANLHVLSKR